MHPYTSMPWKLSWLVSFCQMKYPLNKLFKVGQRVRLEQIIIFLVLIKTGPVVKVLSWQQHRCMMNISGSKFKDHCFNISRISSGVYSGFQLSVGKPNQTIAYGVDYSGRGKNHNQDKSNCLISFDTPSKQALHVISTEWQHPLIKGNKEINITASS